MHRVVETFPSISLPSQAGGLPVEVSLIAQLGHGAGDQLFASISSRQCRHAAFVDELDEPSAKLGGTSFSKGDATSLYSFAVGPKGHPFHRHAGHRVFTAVSGSGGAQLRFSTASQRQIEEDPQSFVQALHFINIPADCLFTVRFGGETWHQFAPLTRHSLHPALFALSCHTNELGGDLSKELKEKVQANEADIPSLTELLPADVAALLSADGYQHHLVPTTTLSLDAAAGTLHRAVCDTVRSRVGYLRGAWGAWHNASGFLSQAGMTREVTELKTLPTDSLLQDQLNNKKLHHEDMFCLSVTGANLNNIGAKKLLALLLEGFLLNAPRGVSRLMALRNLLVKPLGLRTSPLGCPVSSLLSEAKGNLFANQYPVLEQSVNGADTYAQVVLGADDKHLAFRSCVSVRIVNENSIEFALGTRVHCKNAFGRFYMGAINAVHRRYIAPAILKLAADYALNPAVGVWGR